MKKLAVKARLGLEPDQGHGEHEPVSTLPPTLSQQISDLIGEESHRPGNPEGGLFLRTQLEYEGTNTPKE